MDWNLIITTIGTIATVISTIIAIRAKNESKQILMKIREEKSRNASNQGKINVVNEGKNEGFMAGVHTGDVNL